MPRWRFSPNTYINIGVSWSVAGGPAAPYTGDVWSLNIYVPPNEPCMTDQAQYSVAIQSAAAVPASIDVATSTQVYDLSIDVPSAGCQSVGTPGAPRRSE